jgi:hypothetical protein
MPELNMSLLRRSFDRCRERLCGSTDKCKRPLRDIFQQLQRLPCHGLDHEASVRTPEEPITDPHTQTVG